MTYRTQRQRTRREILNRRGDVIAVHVVEPSTSHRTYKTAKSRTYRARKRHTPRKWVTELIFIGCLGVVGLSVVS